MLQQNIWHVAKYQDNKHPKFVQTVKYSPSVHCHFPLINLQPQTCGLIYKFQEEMLGIENVGNVERTYAFFI